VNDFAELDGRVLVIFDGHCGFCNKSVRWFLRRDRKDRLRFAPSESPLVAELLARHGFSPNDFPAGMTTLVVVRDAGGDEERIFVRSDAAIELMAELPHPWSTLGILFRWIPRPLRDPGYRVVARWRYRIWGRLESCPIPTPEERKAFL
jgi:predicted DCC family thiol-disulfide oxidoreductase YuxK